jgi:hypothetical protein
MPGDTKVLYTDEFQKDVTKIKDNLNSEAESKNFCNA